MPQRTRDELAQDASATGLDVVPVAQVEQAARDSGLPPKQAVAVGESYGNALLDALKRSLGAVAFLALVGLWFTRGLPGRTAPAAAPEGTASAAAAPAKRAAAPAGGSS